MSPVSLAYDGWGAGAPVVLLHGLGSDRRRWGPIIDHLPENLRCIAVDLPGHGESPPEGCDVASVVGAVQDLVVGLGLERPVVVGHSLGAVVALLYSAMHHVRAVVAVDPVGLHAPTLADVLAPHRDDLMTGDTLAAFWRFEEDHVLAGDPLAPEIRAGLAPRAEVIRSYWSALLGEPEKVEARQKDLEAALASITVPILVLWADRPRDEDIEVLAGVPMAIGEVWEGHGHWLHLADPRRFARRLQTLVGTLDL